MDIVIYDYYILLWILKLFRELLYTYIRIANIRAVTHPILLYVINLYTFTTQVIYDYKTLSNLRFTGQYIYIDTINNFTKK